MRVHFSHSHSTDQEREGSQLDARSFSSVIELALAGADDVNFQAYLGGLARIGDLLSQCQTSAVFVRPPADPVLFPDQTVEAQEYGMKWQKGNALSQKK